MSTKFGALAYNTIKYIIICIFFLCILYLWLLSGFSTTTITLDSREHSFLIGDSFGLNIAIMLVIVFVSTILSKIKWVAAIANRINNDKSYYKRCKRVLLGLTFILYVLFVLLMKKIPRSDQMDLIISAQSFHDRDYSTFEAGGYVNENPFQMGMILFVYFLIPVFGDHTVLAIQILNVVALLEIYVSFADITELAGYDYFDCFSTMFFSIFFVPATLYTTFVYGILIGLCLSLMSTKHIIMLFRTGEIKYAFTASIFTLAAIISKSNYSIFAIANTIFATCLLFKNKLKTKKVIAIIPVMIIILMFNGTFVSKVSKLVTGQELGKGSSKLSWVAMGLQENENLYDGWWNYYNTASYIDAGYDSTKQKIIVMPYIKDRLAEFAVDTDMAIRFFAGKNASQWNNPDFEGVWVNCVMPSEDGASQILKKFFSKEYSNRLLLYFNSIQFMVLAGVLIYFILPGSKNDAMLPLALAVIGGFVFHTFWEAKSQYLLPYFTLLLPIAVWGYRRFIGIVKNIRSVNKKECKRLVVIICVLALAILSIRFGKGQITNDVFCRNEDRTAYIEYLAE